IVRTRVAAQVQRRHGERGERDGGERPRRFTSPPRRDGEEQDDERVAEGEQEQAVRRQRVAPNDGNGLQNTADAAQPVGEDRERTRAGSSLWRPRRGIDDNRRQETKRGVGERGVPGTEIAKAKVVRPEHNQRGRIPDQSENRGEQGNSAARHGLPTPCTAPDHHRQHAVKRNTGDETDEMDERDEIWSVHACDVSTTLKYCFMNEVRTRPSQYGNGRTKVVAESQ